MLSNAIKKLSVELTDGLAEIAARKLSAEKHLSAALQLARNQLRLLREQILLHPFPDKAAEIHFFKFIKPLFLGAKIFELERYNLEQCRPVGSWERILIFYESELEIIQRFFRQYAYLYQYYRSGLADMDELYFLRGAEVPAILVPEFGEPDPEFSTCCDYLFGRFKAFEQLQEYILEQIRLGLLATQVRQPQAYQSKPLYWTGESLNLVELGYALLDSGQLNNGQAGVGDIFKWMEEHLNVTIGIPARRFVEIKRRKRLSRTRFLDSLRESVNKKIDEDDEYNPEKLKTKRERRNEL